MKKAILTLAASLLAVSPLSLSAQDSQAPVSGVVFNDENLNLELDDGDSRVSSATIALFEVGGKEPVLTTTTGGKEPVVITAPSGKEPVMTAVTGVDPVMTMITGVDGLFAFDGIAAGQYQLQVTYPSKLVARGEVFTVVAGGEPLFFPIPVIDGVSARRYMNFRLVNPANTRGDLVSPFAP